MEVGAFGITRPDDLLYVTDVVLVRQRVTVASVSFENTSVADFFDSQVDQNRTPEQFARIWLHTHPDCSPDPSSLDEATFERVFGGCDWSVMFILARDGSCYARLHFRAGPGGDIEIPVRVDYSHEFEASDFTGWTEQYKANVTKDLLLPVAKKLPEKQDIFGGPEHTSTPAAAEDLIREIEQMDSMERRIGEQAIRSDFWEEFGSEVC